MVASGFGGGRGVEKVTRSDKGQYCPSDSLKREPVPLFSLFCRVRNFCTYFFNNSAFLLYIFNVFTTFAAVEQLNSKEYDNNSNPHTARPAHG